MNRVFVILVPFKLDDGPNEEFLWVNDSYVSPLTSLQIPKDAFFYGILPLDLRKDQGKIHNTLIQHLEFHLEILFGIKPRPFLQSKDVDLRNMYDMVFTKLKH